MVITGPLASLALLISLAFGVADAIRTLKDGPMIDAEGREYKSAPLRTDADNSWPNFNDGPTVRVECSEVSMIVTVKADLYKNGYLVSPGELFLGEETSWCGAVASGDSEYVIEADLQDCGTKLSISEDSIIYSNQLVFSPAVTYRGITRMAHAVVPVSCYYKRRHTVSSNAQQPSLLFFPATYSPGSSAFSLRLMSDDWTRELSSRYFYLGDLLHLEASYHGPDSGQRRLFINSCVATLTPDATSVPRYYFIENHGCLTDSREGSNSLFQPRNRADSLQLQLDTFLLQEDSRNSIYITCQLEATPAIWRSSPINKACNYIYPRWKNVDGNDGVCQCCDTTCTPSVSDPVLGDTVVLGPMMIFTNK
ncbi:zona pellucida sperm-binding protein 3-like [Archocentrus centrarchus]|uniref:zona pellucida sperm-binding protein 3-like n=1 Tax=Archocentrus centrarchus TaxID=63155 RepID=UPI0011EA0F99|nr:zona pellucida sperm-binding protein 3-like [Archocentrus centrarchus]